MRAEPTRMTLALASLLICLPMARAQSSSVLDDPRLTNIRPRLAAAVAAARSERLPEAWVERKVLEGLAKRVPESAIAVAVEALVDRLKRANALVARSVPHGETTKEGRLALVRLTSDALAVGASEARLEALARRVGRHAERRAAQLTREAMKVVAELGERGFDGNTAVIAADRAFQGRQREKGWATLLEAVRTVPEGSPAERRRTLLRHAERIRSGLPDHARGRGAGPPSQRRGPPRDDIRGRGRGRGSNR